MTPPRIDLYSDTLTKPSPAMRQAMAEAEVGDEQKFEDPTTNRLQEMVAELVGKPAALYLPSGTMCNAIAVRVHCRPGDEIIADRTSHVINYEVGGPSALSGACILPLEGARGIFTAEQAEEAVRNPASRHHPRTRVICIEQTSNMGGGTVWPLKTIREVADVAKRHGLAMHMDGARLMNAVVASGVSARDFAAPFDSLWVDFSKGLGAPVGAVLAGSKEFIAEAWRWKQQFGGSMRQSGIIAAACVYALEHNIERLAEDHANARLLAEGLNKIPGITVEPPESNLVFFDIGGTNLSADDLCARLLERGVRVSGGRGPTRLRAVTHLDVSKSDIEEVVEAVREVVKPVQ